MNNANRPTFNQQQTSSTNPNTPNTNFLFGANMGLTQPAFPSNLPLMPPTPNPTSIQYMLQLANENQQLKAENERLRNELLQNSVVTNQLLENSIALTQTQQNNSSFNKELIGQITHLEAQVRHLEEELEAQNKITQEGEEKLQRVLILFEILKNNNNLLAKRYSASTPASAIPATSTSTIPDQSNLTTSRANEFQTPTGPARKRTCDQNARIQPSLYSAFTFIAPQQHQSNDGEKSKEKGKEKEASYGSTY